MKRKKNCPKHTENEGINVLGFELIFQHYVLRSSFLHPSWDRFETIFCLVLGSVCNPFSSSLSSVLHPCFFLSRLVSPPRFFLYGFGFTAPFLLGVGAGLDFEFWVFCFYLWAWFEPFFLWLDSFLAHFFLVLGPVFYATISKRNQLPVPSFIQAANVGTHVVITHQ